VELFLGASFVVGAVLGAIIQRWWLPGVMLALWTTLMVTSLATGSFDSDPDLQAPDWALVLTLLFFLPAWIGAVVAIVIASRKWWPGRAPSTPGKPAAPERPRRPRE
jgi:hypothetical protein